MRTRTSTVQVRGQALAALRSDLDLAKLELERNRVLFERRVVGERHRIGRLDGVWRNVVAIERRSTVAG